MSKRTVVAASIVLVATTIVAIALVSVAAGAGSRGASSGNQLAGTWMVTVNRPAPLPPLRSLQVFTGTGSVIETANEWPATRTESFGSWERVRGRLYAATSVFFRFDPQTGAYLGMQKLNRTIRLTDDGGRFALVARVTVLDVDGNVVGRFGATAAGERLLVERIPEQP